MNTPTKRGFSPFYAIGVDPPVVFLPPVTELDDKLVEQLAAEAEAGYDLDKLVARRRRMTRTYHVELWQQPLHHWLAARVYHWYDSWIYKVPGFKLLERIHRWRYHHGDEDMYVPLDACQDIRCYDLSVKQRQVLATFEVDEPTYQQLTGPVRRS